MTVLLRILVAIQILGQHVRARTNSPMVTQFAWSGRCRETVKTQSAFLKWWSMFFHPFFHSEEQFSPSSTGSSDAECPTFLPRLFRNTLKVAMEEASSSDPTRQERGMESIFVVSPDVSTPSSRRGRAHFTGHVDFKIRGFPTEWRSLWKPAQARCRRRRGQVDDVEQQATRAETLIHLGGKFWRVPNHIGRSAGRREETPIATMRYHLGPNELWPSCFAKLGQTICGQHQLWPDA